MNSGRALLAWYKLLFCPLVIAYSHEQGTKKRKMKKKKDPAE